MNLSDGHTSQDTQHATPTPLTNNAQQGPESAQTLEEPSESEQYHNVSTLSSANHRQQPKFLQNIHLVTPGGLQNRIRKQSRADDRDLSHFNSEMRIPGFQSHFDAEDTGGRTGRSGRSGRSGRNLSPRNTQEVIPQAKSPDPNVLITLIEGEHDPLYSHAESQYAGSVKERFEKSPSPSPSKSNRETGPARSSLYRQFTSVPWKDMAKSLKNKVHFRRSTHPLANKLSLREYEFINDRSHIASFYAAEKGSKTLKGHAPKKLRFKELLEKHSMVRKNVKTEFVQRLLKKIDKRKKSKFGLLIDTLAQGQKKVSTAASFLKEIMSNALYPWHPQGKKRLIWDIVSAICTLYEIILIPFSISFDFDQSIGMMVFEVIKDLFFFLEVLLNFHTGYIADGLCVMSRKKIIKHYLHSWFLVDLVANIPYVELLIISSDGFSGLLDNSYSGTIQYYKVVRLLRIIKWIKIARILERFQQKIESHILSGFLSLFKLLLYIIFMAHWVACIWHLVGSIHESQGDPNWLTSYGFHEENVSQRYVASLYWAITTMLTVGYGDITPVNIDERIANIFTMLAGCCIFAYSMNSIGIILQNINQEVSRKKQKYDLISKYLKRKNVSKSTQKKVEKYLDYLFESNSEKVTEEENALRLLSGSVLEEVQNEINGSFLRQDNLFQVLFGNKFLAILSQNLEERILSPNEIVFDELDTEFSIYFISAGSFELYLTGSKNILKRLERGDHFGEISFFTNRPRTAAAKSITFSSTFLLKKSSLISILEKYSSEKEIYHQIKDKVNLYKDFSDLKLVCYICNDKNHYARACPKIHFQLNPEEVIQKHLDEEKRFCQSFLRPHTRQKLKTLRAAKHIQECAEEFYDHNIQIIKEFLSAQHPSVSSIARQRRFSQFAEKPSNEPRTGLADIQEIDSGSIPPTKLTYPDENYRESENFVSPKQKEVRDSSSLMRVGLYDNEDTILNEAPLDRDFSGGYDGSISKLKRSSMSRKTLRLSKVTSGWFELDMVKNYMLYFSHNNVTKISEKIEKKKMEKSRLEKIQMYVEGVKEKVEKINPPIYRRSSLFTPRGTFTSGRRRSNASFFPHNEV